MGDTDRARQELEIAAQVYEGGEHWEQASEVVGLLVTLVHRYPKSPEAGRIRVPQRE